MITERTIKLNGLYGPVTINIDSNGIPHISTQKNDYDTFFGLGYMHAMHRFWQMEFQRRIASGTLSEIFGISSLEQDKYLRTWGFYRSAKLSWKYFDEETKNIIISYTAGVNKWLSQGKRPLELKILMHKPKPWTTIDSYAWGKMLAWQLQCNSWNDKLNNFFLREKFGDSLINDIRIEYPNGAPTTLGYDDLKISSLVEIELKKNLLTPVENFKQYSKNLKEFLNLTNNIKDELNIKEIAGKGSNAWVLSGKFTDTGKPFLANDIHLEFSAPNIWYLAELRGPTFHATGSTIPGLSAIISGQNENIAWGITDATLDASDLFLLQSDFETQIIKDEIKIRNKQPVSYDIEISPVGPVISNILNLEKDNKEKIAIAWVGLNANDTTIQSFLKLNFAKNWDDFTGGLKDLTTPTLNFFYADNSGNIGHYLPGLIPIRHEDNFKYPVPYEKEHQWQGYVPFDKLPHVYNPSKGYLVNANNRVVPDGYPYQLTHIWKGHPYRAARIESMLQKITNVCLKDMEKIQLDSKSYLWPELKAYMLNTKPKDKLSAQALSYLFNWDGTMNIDSIAASIFAAWFDELRKIEPALPLKQMVFPNPTFICEQLKSNGKYCQIYGAENCYEYLSISLQNAVKKLSLILGKNVNSWKWGNLHKTKFCHPIFGKIPLLRKLWNRSAIIGGDAYTVNAAPSDSNFNQIAGVTFRQLNDLNDQSNSRYIYPLGQSGNPFNRHYSDFLKQWENGVYLKVNQN